LNVSTFSATCAPNAVVSLQLKPELIVTEPVTVLAKSPTHWKYTVTLVSTLIGNPEPSTALAVTCTAPPPDAD